MNEQNKTAKTWIRFRVKPEAYDQIFELFEASTCNNFSEYARRTLLQQPVIVRHRNRSTDELTYELIKIKTELNAIGNKLNQAIHRLHSMKTVTEVKAWILLQETTRQNFIQEVSEIKQTLIKISEQWLQKSPARKQSGKH